MSQFPERNLFIGCSGDGAANSRRAVTGITEMDPKVFKAEPVPYGEILGTCCPRMLSFSVRQAGQTHTHEKTDLHNTPEPSGLRSTIYWASEIQLNWQINLYYCSWLTNIFTTKSAQEFP